jgi:hypothetical protein
MSKFYRVNNIMASMTPKAGDSSKDAANTTKANRDTNLTVTHDVFETLI